MRVSVTCGEQESLETAAVSGSRRNATPKHTPSRALRSERARSLVPQRGHHRHARRAARRKVACQDRERRESGRDAPERPPVGGVDEREKARQHPAHPRRPLPCPPGCLSPRAGGPDRESIAGHRAAAPRARRGCQSRVSGGSRQTRRRRTHHDRERQSEDAHAARLNRTDSEDRVKLRKSPSSDWLIVRRSAIGMSGESSLISRSRRGASAAGQTLRADVQGSQRLVALEGQVEIRSRPFEHQDVLAIARDADDFNHWLCRG